MWPSGGTDASLLPCSHTCKLHVLRKAEENLFDMRAANTIKINLACSIIGNDVYTVCLHCLQCKNSVDSSYHARDNVFVGAP